MAKVKEVFNELELKKEYESFEDDKYKKIMIDIDNLTFESNSVSPEQTNKIKLILKMYANKIFKRIK